MFKNMTSALTRRGIGRPRVVVTGIKDRSPEFLSSERGGVYI